MRPHTELRRTCLTNPWTLLTAPMLLAAATALAQLPPAQYEAALRAAENQVARSHGSRPPVLAQFLGLNQDNVDTLPLATLEQLPKIPRYQAGRHWDVVTWQESRVTNPLTGISTQPGKLRTFRYEVKAADGRQLTVTPTEDYGLPSVDRRVQDLDLTLSKGEGGMIEQSGKSYAFKGRADRVVVSANGLRSRMTAMETFPLDFPNLDRAERVELAPAPTLPAPLRAFLSNHGLQLDEAQGSWYESSDLFGRSIRMLWKDGEPWPRLLETSQGISALLEKETST